MSILENFHTKFKKKSLSHYCQGFIQDFELGGVNFHVLAKGGGGGREIFEKEIL